MSESESVAVTMGYGFMEAEDVKIARAGWATWSGCGPGGRVPGGGSTCGRRERYPRAYEDLYSWWEVIFPLVVVLMKRFY